MQHEACRLAEKATAKHTKTMSASQIRNASAQNTQKNKQKQ